MKKKIFIMIICLFLSNCSFNTSSELWKNNTSQKKSVTRSAILNDEINFQEYKNKIINYSYNSTFPEINN